RAACSPRSCRRLCSATSARASSKGGKPRSRTTTAADAWCRAPRCGAAVAGGARDAAPSVSARDPGIVYYQSSGVARHAQTGQAAAIGPAALLKLDTRTARRDTVLEDKNYDYLAPREDRSGNLWFIRRPYEKTTGEVAFD